MSGLEKHLFNLKFAAKQLQRNSKKSTKEEAQEQSKLKKVITRL
jgi:charged multivesicular body protein 1